nr:VWA domain-containing protein [Paenactinomyces guangxiensis]
MLVFSLLVLALARTQFLSPVNHQSVVFVVDRSASIQNPDEVLHLLQQAVAEKKPDDQVAVVSTGAASVVERSLTETDEVPTLSAVINKNATDLASGLRLAGGMLPADAEGRVVLITDGNETKGSAEAEARMLRERGVRVDVIPLRQKEGPEVLVSDLQVPERLYANEKATLKVKVTSTADTRANLRLFVGNRMLETQNVLVNKGENQYSFSVPGQGSGFLRYRVEIQANRDTLPNNNQAYGFSQVTGKPIVLVVEGNKGEAANLISALRATGVQVEQTNPAGLPGNLENYQRYSSIVLVNTPAYSIPEYKMEQMRTAVKDLGIGLIMSGGEEGFALGGWFRTPIEEALPVHMDLRDKKRVPSLGLMLVIDKSGSMSGEKIDLAKEAAIRATELLTPQDQLGVLAFDDGNDWVVQPQLVKNHSEIQGRIGTIPADGGTNIYPALEAAYQKVRQLKVKRKHMILLTDGQSPGGNYQALAERLKKEKITLSTVAVGADADQALLQSLADGAKGRYYLATDAGSIPTIFSKEASMAIRSYIIDQPFIPKWTGGSDWFAAFKGVPPLRGYVATTPKQTAETVLASHYPDPVLARWQYGLGRTVAWTSDLNGKWSKAWVGWQKFSPFWNHVVSWTFPQYDTSGLYIDCQIEGSTVRLEAKGPPERFASADQVRFTVIDDKLNKKQVVAKAVAPGHFAGSFQADQPGTYLLQASAKGKAGEQPVGTYGISVPYSPEYNLMAGGEERVRKIAAQGGGSIITDLSQSFADNLEDKWAGQDISLFLLLLAALLWPVDIAVRRISVSGEDWRRIKNRLTRPAQVSSTPYTQQLGKIQQKSRKAVKRRIKDERTGPEISEAIKQTKTKQNVVSIPDTKGKKNVDTAKTEPSTDSSSRDSGTKSRSDETHLSRLLAAKRKREKKL